MKKTTSLSMCNRATSLNILRLLLKSSCLSLLFIGSQLKAQCGGIAENASIASDLGTGPGNVAWTNPTNVEASDNVYTAASTTVAPGVPQTTHYLSLRNLGYAIPGGSTICGIVVAIKHRKNGGAGVPIVKDNIVQLTNGSFTSSNYGKVNAWSDTSETFVYGSETDTWGVSWTPSDVNQPGFALNIAAKITAGSSITTLAAEIDNAYVIIYTNAVLPVELTSFNAKKVQGDKVQLDWSTATETNNSFFVVQRSKDAVTFTDMVHVKGAGSSLQTNSYSIIDPQPLQGTSYYRLKQVDMNGHEKIYPITQIYIGSQWSVDPVSQQGLIVVHAPEDNALTQVDLINFNGERMYTIQRDKDDNSSEVRIDVTNVPSGLYFVKAVSGEELYCAKTFLLKE